MPSTRKRPISPKPEHKTPLLELRLAPFAKKVIQRRPFRLPSCRGRFCLRRSGGTRRALAHAAEVAFRAHRLNKVTKMADDDLNWMPYPAVIAHVEATQHCHRQRAIFLVRKALPHLEAQPFLTVHTILSRNCQAGRK